MYMELMRDPRSTRADDDRMRQAHMFVDVPVSAWPRTKQRKCMERWKLAHLRSASIATGAPPPEAAPVAGSSLWWDESEKDVNMHASKNMHDVLA